MQQLVAIVILVFSLVDMHDMVVMELMVLVILPSVMRQENVEPLVLTIFS